jgi:Zn-dependent peptidase ImmA (M78 family)
MDRIALNPKVLRWARESANLSIDDVADRIEKDAATIREWEKGDSFPTYVQLETLAYTIYRRPIAVFFFPEPPEEMTAQKSFRTLPQTELESLSPHFFHLFRQAQVMQLNLHELNAGTNPAQRKIFRDLAFRPSDKVEDLARRVREYLGISLSTQANWRDSDIAFKEWRRSIELAGIFVFKNAFRQDDVSGFCLYDDEFPVIYVNNSAPRTRQIFTLFHELTHLLVRTSGIDMEHDSFLRHTQGEGRRVEVLCNRFAGEFLLPSDAFARLVRGREICDELVQALADKYKISREVVLRKCLDKGLVSQEYYEERRGTWIEEARKARQRATGGDYYNTRVAYLGDSYLNLVFTKYSQNQFSLGQLAEYLCVKATHIPNLEAVFLTRGEPA